MYHEKRENEISIGYTMPRNNCLSSLVGGIMRKRRYHRIDITDHANSAVTPPTCIRNTRFNSELGHNLT